MGRYRELWASGKFANNARAHFDQYKEREAVSLLKEVSPELEVDEKSAEVLQSLKSRRGQETGRWLKGLVPAAAIHQQVTEAANQSIFESLTAWVERLFRDFQELAYEFNKSAIGTDLLVSCEPPMLFETKSDDVWYRPVTKTYVGRLSTRDWALVVRGQESKIEIFLLPSGMLLAFNSGQITEHDYPPFLEVIHSSQDNFWKIVGESAPLETVPLIAKEVFGDLVRVASGEMSESELFSSSTAAPKLGENMAVGYKAGETSAKQQAAVKERQLDLDQMNVFDACDLVDAVIERELKKYYEKATKLTPEMPESAAVRKQISSVEAFRIKMLNAFAEFTHRMQDLSSSEKCEPGAEPIISRR